MQAAPANRARVNAQRWAKTQLWPAIPFQVI